MLNFSVPNNWQEDLISKLAKNDINNIEELYGKFSQDIVGGGRASVVLPYVSKRNLAQRILEIHKYGIKFNYLLNATCLDNLEWSSSWQREFRKFLDYLVKIGVDKVTVSIPYLLELIKKQYPSLKICVSVHAGIKSLHQAKFWEDLGADEITLFMDLNRNFFLLRNIKKKIKCKLRLIANVACLYGCPFYHYHGNLQTHASQSTHPSKGFVIDYYTLRCRLIRFTHPEELIRSRWIRPEDISIYEDIGIDTVKFVDRSMKTETICLIVDAYSNREYKGNLLDLFSDPSKNLNECHINFQKVKYFFRPFRINVFRLYKAKELFKENTIYIDNRALNGFLNFFKDINCDLISCQECRYCYDIAEKVIKIPPDFNYIYLKKYETFVRNIVSGRLFRYF